MQQRETLGPAIVGAATIGVFAKLQGMERACRIPRRPCRRGPESKRMEQTSSGAAELSPVCTASFPERGSCALQDVQPRGWHLPDFFSSFYMPRAEEGDPGKAEVLM